MLLMLTTTFLASVGQVDSTQRDINPVDWNVYPCAQSPRQYPHVTNSNDDISSLTLAVNTVNNILTFSSLVVAILTIATILIGFLGYKRLANKIDGKISEIDGSISTIEKFGESVREMKYLLTVQQKYVNSANDYLYESTEQLVNQMDDDKSARILYEKLVRNYHLTNLYAWKKETRFASLAYLREQGRLEDIEHIEVVATSDIDESNRKLAGEIIGIIKYREATNEKNIDN